MSNEPESQPIAGKTSRPWVGVLLAFFISGSAHFLAGNKRAGIVWFAIIAFFKLLAIGALGSSLIPGILPGIVLVVIAFALWLSMLVKSCQPVPRLRLFGWVIFMCVAAVLEISLSTGARFFFHPYSQPTGSMEPTIQGKHRQSDGTTTGGDHFFVEEYAYWFKKPARGDVIVYKNPDNFPSLAAGRLYIKRVAAIPGDILSIHEGHLYNHGQPVTHPATLANLVIMNPPNPTPQYLADSNSVFEVPAGQYFILGDNTLNSLDSRFVGTISETNILGKVSKIYWPLSRAGQVQ